MDLDQGLARVSLTNLLRVLQQVVCLEPLEQEKRASEAETEGTNDTLGVASFVIPTARLKIFD